MFDSHIYIQRRKKLMNKLGSGLIVLTGNVDVPMNYADNVYRFRQDSTFLYFFGLDRPGLHAIMDCDKGTETIYGNELSMDDIVWMGSQLSLSEQAIECGIKNTLPTTDFEAKLQDALKSGQQIHMLPAYRAENKVYLAEICGCTPKELSRHVSEALIKACVALRSVKEEVEVSEIEKQSEVAYLMHTTAMWMAQPGASEHQIAGAIEGIALGADGTVSFPIILTRNGQTLHNHYHGNILQRGDLMLVDAGCEGALHYATDHTRTTPVGGVFSNRQKDIYNIVLRAMNTAKEASKPGRAYRECHLLAAKTIALGLKDLGLMKGDVDAAVEAGAHALFFPHGLGHMMGLDVHDMEGYGEDYVGYSETIKRSTQFGTRNLRLGRELEEGFVVTNEPGIYFIPELIDLWQGNKMHAEFINYNKVNSYRNFGGIRLEDDLLITKHGAKLLGKKIPLTTEQVEAVAMGKP